jgi:hypothetical protein
MRGLLLSWLLSVPSWAEPPKPPKPPTLSLAVPSGPPPAAKLAALEGGFTLNAEVLERYQYTLEGYNKLSSSEQQRVFDWIRILERERLLAEARADAAGGVAQDPGAMTDRWTADQHATLGRLRLRAEAPGRFFDGSVPYGTGSDPAGGKSYFTPEVELFGLYPTTLPDGTRGTGMVRRLTLVGPDGLRLEYGNLGLAPSVSPLILPSPYFSVSKEGSESGPKVDVDYKLRANAVGLGARLYTNDAPGLDRRIDQSIDSLGTLDPIWGVGAEDVSKIRDQFSFSHSFEREWMFVGSALVRVGRAYQITPRWDVGWSAMGVMRWAGLFPNLTLDQTLGSRVHLGEGHYFGGFVGVTEGLGLFAQTMVKDSFASEDFDTKIRPQAAPHQHVALWGKMPYLSNVEYSLVGGQQFNPWSTLYSIGGSLAVPAGQGKIGSYFNYSQEGNEAMEFDRRKTAVGLTYSPIPGIDLWGQYSQDSARFGSASMDMKGAFFGLTVTETNGPAKGSKITLETLVGGHQGLVSQESRQQFVERLQETLDALQALKDAGFAFTNGPDGAWQAVQDAWARLSPATQAFVANLWGQAAPGAPPLRSIIATKPADFKTISQLVDLLSDTRILERLLVRAIRHEILKELSEVEIPVLGHKIRMSAPLVIAAAHAYGLSLTPLPPITEKDARESLDKFLLDKIGKEAGCAAGPQPRATTDCILSKIPEKQRDELRAVYGNNLDQLISAAVKWPSDVIRHEMNKLALQVILAAETLNEISVDGGQKIADLNVRGLMKSFEYLDKRSRKFQKGVYERMEKGLRDELAEQESAMRAYLQEYGSGRLSWLQQQASWPANVQIAVRPEDWADLLAIHGDAKLFDMILRIKGKMAAPAQQQYAAKTKRLLISLDRHNPLNAITFVRGDPSELKLPAKAVDLKHLEYDF